MHAKIGSAEHHHSTAENQKNRKYFDISTTHSDMTRKQPPEMRKPVTIMTSIFLVSINFTPSPASPAYCQLLERSWNCNLPFDCIPSHHHTRSRSHACACINRCAFNFIEHFRRAMPIFRCGIFRKWFITILISFYWRNLLTADESIVEWHLMASPQCHSAEAIATLMVRISDFI